MDSDKHNEVVVLLANDALEATAGVGPLAALLLIDAALSIAITRLGVTGATEMAGMLSDYIADQMQAVTAQFGGAA